MANTRELRRRIKSIKNTSQITRAMQMVAATKMRRAQTQALSGRPYQLTLEEALVRLSGSVESVSPFFASSGGANTGVLLLTSDKSLCGALNTNIFRALLASHPPGGNSTYYTVGKKGRNFAVKTGKLEADFENPEVVTFRGAKQIAKLLIDSFLKGQLDEVHLVYPNFISTLKQEPEIVKLLPIDTASLKTNNDEPTNKLSNNDFLFEPKPDELLDLLLVHKIETKIYQALLETKASEHSARMVAMKNATDNAKELVEDLTLSYNQIRQSSITNELLEITSAQAALE